MRLIEPLLKVGNDQPDCIAKYVSTLRNSTVLCGKPTAYLFWCIDDSTHEVVGTPRTCRNLRKCGVCEERGSGHDKIIMATCANGLTARSSFRETDAT